MLKSKTNVDLARMLARYRIARGVEQNNDYLAFQIQVLKRELSRRAKEAQA